MDKMTFITDRTSLTEGEVIEINWNCTGADKVELTIDNGYKVSTLALDIVGTKRFRLNRSKGKTQLSLTASVGGKDYTKTIKVRVDELPVTDAETLDQNGRVLGGLGKWWHQKFMPKWQSLRTNGRSAWQQLPPNKKMAARILLLLAALLLLSMVAPWLFSVGLLALMGYLVWVIWKR